VVGVEQWAEIRRLYFVRRLSIKEIVSRTGHVRRSSVRCARRVLAFAEALDAAGVRPGGRVVNFLSRGADGAGGS
jgi:hypothetical protein